MEVVDYNSELFPESLKKIKNPPKVLYAKGNLDLLNTYSVSIIGSRACSINGMQSAKMFASELSKQGLTIVSGMALGIDSAAHIGTLEAGGKTIAVLGCGFDNIFPKQNIKLFHEIINNGGLVLSEYAPETNADSKKFLQRNRIVSALSIGVLVIEAAHRSGTSVTCKFAREQGKEIFCIPHNLEDLHGKGTNRLIKEGAHLVTDARDIVENFSFLQYKDFNAFDAEYCNSDADGISKKGMYNLKFDGDFQDEFRMERVNDEFAEVYELLIGPPLNFSEICNCLNKAPEYVAKALLILEIKGMIVKNQFGYQIKNI